MWCRNLCSGWSRSAWGRCSSSSRRRGILGALGLLWCCGLCAGGGARGRLVVSAENPPRPERDDRDQDDDERNDQARVASILWGLWRHALTGGAVDGLKTLLSVAKLLMTGLGCFEGGPLRIPGLLGAGLLSLAGLGCFEGRPLRIPGLRGGLLWISLLLLSSGYEPLVVAHSYLLASHGRRFRGRMFRPRVGAPERPLKASCTSSVHSC